MLSSIELAELKTLITKINLLNSSITVLNNQDQPTKFFSHCSGPTFCLSKRVHSTAGFLNLGFPVHLKGIQAAFCPVSTRYQQYLPAVTTNNVSKHCQMSPEGQNHSWLGTTNLQVGLKFFYYIISLWLSFPLEADLLKSCIQLLHMYLLSIY